MDKPDDLEVQSEIEAVFDCCGCMAVAFDQRLLGQMLDGINTPLNNLDTFTQGNASYYRFWLTPNPKWAPDLFIDAVYTWNPALTTKSGKVAQLMFTASPLGTLQNPCLVGPNDIDTNIPKPMAKQSKTKTKTKT